MNTYPMRVAVALLLGLMAMPAVAQSLIGINQVFNRQVSLVNLVLRFDAATACNSGRAFYKRFPDGTLATEEFTVPDPGALVITDFRWSAIPTPAAFASNAILQAVLQSRLDGGLISTIYTSSAINLTPDFSTMNRIAGSDTINSGIGVGSGRTLCVFAESKTVSFTAFHTVASAEINGYILKKR